MKELKSNSVSGRDYNSVYASASSGDVDAQIKLGKMYRDGDGVEKDGKKAVEWLTRAAEQGRSDAHYFLAVIYATGNGVPLSYSKALEWFKFPLDQGDSDTQVYVGWLHENGFGVPKDNSKAAEYYALAAEQCNSSAQYYLGNFYEQGLGVPKDENKAFEYYTLSAQQGDSDAQANLGAMYIARHDYEKGKDYLRMAGENGNQRALETLKKIEAVQEKHRIEDSIKKFTCTVCKKQNPWGQKYCSHCSSIVKYAPAWKYVWLGVLTGVVTAGYGLTQGASLTEAAFAFVFPWLAVMLLAKLFGGTRAVSIP